MSSRRSARRAAIDILYAADIRGDLPDVDDDADPFTHELVHGVVGNLTELDAVLTGASADWSVARMASVDRAILRIATFELTGTATPPAVVIDEAVAAATELSTDESGRFVNGVLRGVVDRPQPAP